MARAELERQFHLDATAYVFESLCLGYGENIGVLSETVVSQNAKSWKIELGLGYRRSYSSFDFDPRVVFALCIMCCEG